MKRHYITDGIQIMIAILMTGSMAYAMQPTAISSPHSAPKAEEVQTSANKPEAVTAAQETPKNDNKIEAPQPTWRDNPQNCDQTTQYIAEEAPFDCIDKPVTTSVKNVASAPVHAAVDDGSAKMFIYNHESGNNPGSINRSSGACGLGQALPCSKMGCSLSDYACQDAFFTNYMISRYGTWENAKAFWIANQWW